MIWNPDNTKNDLTLNNNLCEVIKRQLQLFFETNFANLAVKIIRT